MSDLKSKLEISPDKLQYRCSEDSFKDFSFEDIDPCCGIIGQDRAMIAVEQGLEIDTSGYNIFVTGMPGTGRTTAVKLLLEAANGDEEVVLKDVCYVNNFMTPESPQALYFPAGEGRKFQKAVNYLIDSLVMVIPKIFSGDNYRQKRERIIKEFDSRQKELFIEFEKSLKEQGFALVQLQYGNVVKPDLHPIVDGEPVSIGELEKAVIEEKFPAEKLEEIKELHEKLTAQFKHISRNSHKISEDLEDELARLDTSMVVPLINGKVETLRNRYEDEKIKEYLRDLNEILIQELDIFRPGQEAQDEQDGAARLGALFEQFSVNLILDNADNKKRPIVIEEFPTYNNLFGTIERYYTSGSGWRSDFTRIRGGSILQADGGYLVINAVDLFTDPRMWPTLKRTLRTGHLAITGSESSMMSGTSLKPEVIDIDVKVILIGDRIVYDALLRADADFKKVFKIKAEFDNVMTNDKAGNEQYAQFIKKITAENELLPMDNSGLAAVVEYGAQLAGRKDRLSTRFTRIADVVREATWMAEKKNKTVVNRDIIKETIEMQRRRVDLVETKIQEMYEREIYLIDVTGHEVGQINGLSVYDLGEHSFGRPTRITASVSPGADGVINIEREAAMSGRTHDKGVLILSGFMRNRFGKDKPLVLTASLCFEQSYSGVDGDSASSTEIYALLSALTDIPINQALAVTGSVNQKGEIQPIGGVNQKIEGFFDVCSINGLTGEQGVLIPKQNEADVMLKDSVVDAIREGKFHVYSVSTIDEGIELLTGVPAGKLLDDGTFDRGSINDRAQKRLNELAAIWRDYIRP
ncbi:MAG: ATP-binding protein [Candidatus Zixiibacteriota bacterium]